MSEVAPHLIRHDVIETVSPEVAKVGIVDVLAKSNHGVSPVGAPLKNPIENFYFTDVISRSSATMARCVASFGAKVDKITDTRPDINF